MLRWIGGRCNRRIDEADAIDIIDEQEGIAGGRWDRGRIGGQMEER